MQSERYPGYNSNSDVRVNDRQSEAQSTKFTSDASIGLGERVEDSGQHAGIDSHSAVGYLDDHTLLLSPAADAYAAAGGRELDGVLDEIPEHLLQPPRIRFDRFGASTEVSGKV